MCIAIAQPKGTDTLSIDQLERGWTANPDGGGYAYINEYNDIVVVKDMDMDSFILQYVEAHGTYGADSPFIIHMRIATHGSVTLANCHPFTAPIVGDGDMVFMHNGIIDKVTKDIEGTDLTDTEGLGVFVLSDLHDEWLDNEHLVSYIEDFIDYSKLVFLTTAPGLDKELYILNESNGTWDSKIWYSNYSCFEYKSTKKTFGSSDYQTSDKRFGWYKNGHYIEGTTDDDWYVDPHDRRTDAQTMRDADRDGHIRILQESLDMKDVCGVCTGILSCLCPDLCYECYEAYHDCECVGDFVSLTDSYSMLWGKRIQDLAGEYPVSKPQLTVVDTAWDDEMRIF